MVQYLYFCSSFEQISLAVFLKSINKLDCVVTWNRDVFAFFMKIGMTVKFVEAVDLNSLNRPIEFLSGLYRLRSAQKALREYCENKVLYSPIFSNDLGLLKFSKLCRKRKQKLTFIEWEDSGWSSGEKVTLLNIPWRMLIRLLVYKIVVDRTMTVRSFNHELYFSLPTKLFGEVWKIPNRTAYMDKVAVVCKGNKAIQRDKIIFLASSYRYVDMCRDYTKERVDAVLSLLCEFRTHVIIKLHPGQPGKDYFGTSKFHDMFECYREPVPAEVLIDPSHMTLSFGSVAQLYLSKKRMYSYCLGRIGRYGQGNLSYQITDSFLEKGEGYIKRVDSLTQMRSLLQNYVEKKSTASP